MTASMHIAMNDLRLDALYVVYPGTRRYVLDHRLEQAAPSRPIEVVPVADLGRMQADWM